MGRLKKEVKFYKAGIKAYNELNYIEALDCFQTSIGKNPDFFKAWVFKGLILSLLERYEESNLCYDNAIEIRAYNSWPWQNKGWNLIKLGRYTEAMSFLERAIEIAQRNSTAWSMKGDCLLMQNKLDEAMICFGTAIEINPRNECHWNGKGCVLINRGQLEDALNCLNRAIDLNSENENIWFNKGIVLYKQGNYNLSIKCFDKANELNPKNLEAIYHKSMALKELGKIDDALINFNKIRILDLRLFESLRNQEAIPRISEIIGPKIKIDPQPTIEYPPDYTHEEIQWVLSKLGCQMNLNVWVAKNDRNKEIKGKRFLNIPRLAEKLPVQFDSKTNKIIELIDVLWLEENKILSAFEIESTTSIYSGLLRMSDLISMQPNINIQLYIVAPDERRNKVISEINRPTFSRLKPPLNTICRYISFSKLKEKDLLPNDVKKHLLPSFLDEISEPCESCEFI